MLRSKNRGKQQKATNIVEVYKPGWPGTKLSKKESVVGELQKKQRMNENRKSQAIGTAHTFVD